MEIKPETAPDNAPAAVLAGCCTGADTAKYARSMAELRGLAKACGLRVSSVLVQNAASITHATFLGSGKVAELKAEVEAQDANIVIFNESLTPMQTRNLEKELDTEVLDRTGLILQIFASRARTREAKLQVESARLQYMLPRLVGMRASLSRQGGGSGRLSNKGAGEQKLELDRRRIEKRIAELRRELAVVDRERATQRSRRLRTGLTRVSLVGYTNAGKSTILNALLDLDAAGGKTDAGAGSTSDRGKTGPERGSFTAIRTDGGERRDPTVIRTDGGGKNVLRASLKKTDDRDSKKVFEADMLFATLDTSVRKIQIPGHLPFLLSDTVGFVSDLPHGLVKAFRSTLEEVCCADLLLEVVDFSDPDYQEQIEVTARTLEEIGAGQIPVLYLYNKTDLAIAEISSPAQKSRPAPSSIPFRRGETLYLAAGKGIGVDGILTLIDDFLSERCTVCEFCIPYTKGGLMQEIRRCGVLLSEEYRADGIIVRARCLRTDAERIAHSLKGR